MALQLVNTQASFSETILTANSRLSLRDQVARSKGNEWMISSYKAWQERSPLAKEPIRNTTSVLRLVRKITPNEPHVNRTLAFSFRVVVLLVTLLVLGIGR